MRPVHSRCKDSTDSEFESPAPLPNLADGASFGAAGPATVRWMQFLLLAGALLSRVPAAAGGVAAPDIFDLKAIDTFLTAYQQKEGPVGMSVAIVKDGKLVWARGYGKRSLKPALPVETNTLFAIGSITKQFTCACILLLAEDGKLSVRDPVAKYYPKLTRARDITLLDLMNHVSGYPDYYPLDFVVRSMQRPIDPDELLRQYAGSELDFEPGTKWSYSNTGFILLGRVVEKVSGEPFGAFLARRVLRPLKLTHTVYEPDPSDGRLARGYTSFALSPPEPVAPEGKGWIGAAGGIYSTPSDLATWDLALMNGELLKPESFQLMTTPRPLAGGKLSEYGCGLLLRVQGGRRIVYHNGAVSGFVAWNAMIPSTRSALIMTANENEGLGSLPSRLFALLLKEPSNIPIVAGPSALETVKEVFRSLQRGKVDRRQFSDEFNHFLTDKMIAGAAQRLSRLGVPQKIEVISAHERGGLEVTSTRLTFKSRTVRVLMYRQPTGIIEQFFVDRE
jgi:D-alanyl-D-alanine carboxypeptidase